MPNKRIPFLPKVFKVFLDHMLDQANEVLTEYGLLPTKKKSALSYEDPIKELFGSESHHYRNYEQRHWKYSLAYAIHLRLKDRHGQDNWTRVYGLKRKNFNPRSLQDTYSEFVNHLNRDTVLEEEAIWMRMEYVRFHLHFIDLEDPYPLLESDQLDEQIIEAQRELFRKYWDDGIEIYPKKEVLYYFCYTLDSEKPEQLLTFKAVFDFDRDKSVTDVVLQDTPSGEGYYGSLELLAGGNEAIIKAQTRRDHNVRPLLILISKNSRRQFRELPVCVGSFVNVSMDSETYTGAIVFEKRQYPDAFSRLDADMVRFYLQKVSKRISTGGFHTLEEFITECRRLVPRYEEELALHKSLEGRYYECFILSKKRQLDQDSELTGRLERTLFHFEPNGKFICQSAYPTRCEIYSGKVRYHSHYKATLEFSQKDKGIYLLPIDYQRLLDSGQFEGVYSGITQEGMLAAGRARFFEISEDRFREGPRVLEWEDPETEALLESIELRDFFSGLHDKYLDDPQYLRREPRHLQHGGNQQLQALPGTYYYYRTRTIKAHIREVKSYPVLIKPNGELSVKVKDDGEEYPATGIIFRLNGRGYLHLRKKSKYDGLAIIYPDWQLLGHEGEVIPGLYVSTSKADHLMAGRLFFRRYSFDTTGADFEELQPLDISIDRIEANLKVDPADYKIIRQLCGQINNYIAIRHPEADQPHQNYGRELFLAACYLSEKEKDYDWAAGTLKRAILYGGYRDVEHLRGALTQPQGPLYPIRERVKNFPNEYKVNDHSGHERDVHRYLKELVKEVFEGALG